MTSEIKQKIEQIRNGEVPKGYKRTRAGIMPCDWCTQKEYKAKDIFYSVSNKNHNGDYEVLSATQDRGVIPRSQVDIDIKYDDANTSGYKMVDKGDFVISLRSFQGGIEYSEYTGLVSPAYTVLKPKVSICDEYYKSYFKTNDFISRLNKGTYGIRDGKQVGFKDFGEMTIHFPPLPEQQRIAKILSAQDKVIECYEKKIEQLKRMKKYYLQNMFPKHGETVPKIRFKEFTDTWISKRFSEFSWISGKRNKDNLDLEPYAITNEHGFIPQSEAHDEFGYMEKTDRKAYIIVSSNSFAYNPARINVGSIGYYKGSNNVIVSSLYEVFKTADSICDSFLWYWFQTAEFSNWIQRLQEGSVRQYFYYDKMCEVKLYIPSLQEQKKIAEAFIVLDSIITNHQRKLEEEKKKKKALQQLLLTGIVRA